jgi:hypothetical protein
MRSSAGRMSGGTAFFTEDPERAGAALLTATASRRSTGLGTAAGALYQDLLSPPIHGCALSFWPNTSLRKSLNRS